MNFSELLRRQYRFECFKLFSFLRQGDIQDNFDLFLLLVVKALSDLISQTRFWSGLLSHTSLFNLNLKGYTYLVWRLELEKTSCKNFAMMNHKQWLVNMYLFDIILKVNNKGIWYLFFECEIISRRFKQIFFSVSVKKRKHF